MKHRFSWNSDFVVKSVQAGADTVPALRQAMINHCANIGRAVKRIRLECVRLVLKRAVDAGEVRTVQESGGVVRIVATGKPPLQRAAWRKPVDVAMILQAVGSGASDRFELADWLTRHLGPTFAPVSPVNAEAWSKLTEKAGAAIQRTPIACGKPPYVHNPDDKNRTRFHRYAICQQPQAAAVPDEADDQLRQCEPILRHFALIPATLPPQGAGRVHHLS